MRLIFVLALFISTVCAICAQNRTVIEPLEEELKTCKKTSRLTQIHLDLLKEYEIYNTKESLKHGIAAWEAAAKDTMEKEMATAAYYLGMIYQFDGNEADKAVYWYYTALGLADKMKDAARITDCSYNLGLLLSDIGDSGLASRYLSSASAMAAARKDYTMVAMAEIAYGDRLKSKEEKLKHYQNALTAVSQSPLDTVSGAQVWSAMGSYYYGIKDENLSKYWYEKVFRLLHGKVFQSNDHYLLELYANSCLRTGRYDEAIQAAGRIVSVRNSPGSSEWYSVEGMKLLAEGFHYNGYDSLAFWTIMEYTAKKDSLQEIRNNISVNRYAKKLKDKFEDERQQQKTKLENTQNRYERFSTYVLIVGLISMVFLSLYLYRKRQKEFNQNKQLARLNQTKDKLLSIISHDVRSPVQALQNIINLFEQDIATKEDVHTVTKQVSASVQSMMQGLDNLFYWAQSQQQELKAYPEPINLSQMVRDLMEMFSVQIKKKGITVQHQLNEPVYIVSDLLHTQLIISNILVNAIKFSPPEGIINITFTSDEAGNAVLSIADSGKGISAVDIDKIFDPTVRYTRPGTLGEPGSGLGLSLTKDLLVLDNNEIVINSQPGMGTRIDLVFRRK